MSPKFYGSLWIVFAVVAGILGIGGVFNMLMAVVFGFIAFGLVFAGMICVLPGTVSHPPVKKAATVPEPGLSPANRPGRLGKEHVRIPFRIRAH